MLYEVNALVGFDEIVGEPDGVDVTFDHSNWDL